MVTAILSLSLTFFAAEPTVAAETTTYLASIADASILENAPTTNYGGAATLGADGDRPSGSGKDRYGLLRWDLGGIAPGTKISSASVTLSVTNSSTQTYEAYALNRAWVESEVTWSRYAAGKPWEVAGAKGSLDREATATGKVTPSATGELTFALPAALVQRWVDDPATNRGIIVANATNPDEFEFYSRESATSSQRPRLNVVHEGVDSAPPETTIDSAPSDVFSNASASFTFSSNEVNSTFECRVDGAAFSSCTSPKSYTNLSEGSHTFGVRATDAAGNTDPTPASRTWIVDTSSAQKAPVLVGAGDIARCSSPGDEATAKLLDGISGTIYTTGDNAYESGTAAEFSNCYEPSWGRHKARTQPTPGNHEYKTAGALGYFNYFGTAAGNPSKGYYSYNLGEWHIVSLNSMCDQVGGCTEGSPMVAWLKQDLAANPKTCTLAYFHHPLFSSGAHGNQTFMKPTWDALYAADADVVLNGHDHHYERFAPQAPSGAADSTRGIREFVVGMGGGSHYGIVSVQPNSEVRNTDTYGVLKLTLHPSSYEWKFVPEAGKSFADSGSDQCHGAPSDTDTVAPTVSSVAPTDGATDVAVTADAEATFSEAMNPNTISPTTFTLAKQGSTQPIAAAVSYDGPTKKATLDPNVDLEADTTYTATLKSGAMGVKDLAGNPLGADKTWSFSTAAGPLLPLPDITAPETAIDSGPSGAVSSTSASFAFSSGANASFQCSLDGDPFEACVVPKEYANLSEGAHTFQVRATDADGETDATPASRSWTVDATAPALKVPSGPVVFEATGPTGAVATYQVSAEDAVDPAPVIDCTPATGNVFPPGDTTVTCTATDKAANKANGSFTVTVRDTTAPETAIGSGPSGTVSSSSASFVFSSSEPDSTFECSLDGGVFGACTSPKSYTGLSVGNHTFGVKATDAAGNTDPTPASRSWTVATAKTASVTSTADTYMLQNAPKKNYGTATSLGVGGDEPAGTGKDKYTLLKWNLPTIPAGSKISSASVTLNVADPSAQTYQAYELKRPWVESAATWQLYAAAKSWQIAGAKGSLDRGATEVGTVSPSATGKQTFALSPAVVQSWVDNPSSNNGIIIANATNADGFTFSSRESTTSSLRPQLNVTYTAF